MLSTTRKVYSRKISERQPEKSPGFTIVPSGKSKAIASSAQQRILFDQQIHYDPLNSPAIYNILIPAKIKRGSMSISRIKSAITATLKRHTILRTAVYFNQQITITHFKLLVVQKLLKRSIAYL